MPRFQELIKLKRIKNNYKYKKCINILLYLILFSIYLPFCFSKDINNIKRKLEYDNEITIKIFGSGEQFVVYQYETITPNEIYVNGELKATSSKKVDLGEEEGEYTITLKWNTPQSNFYRLFFFLNILEVDISKLDTSNIENMSSMFKGCSKLTSIYLGNNINTSTLTSMAEMFYGCSQLTSLDLNILDTSNVNDMKNMFYDCKNLKELHIENFDTSNVETMESMFYECRSLTTLDLSNFRTSSVTNMVNMFLNCQSLISLNLQNFDTSNVQNINRIFYQCISLISLNINSFDTSNIENPQFCFDGVKNDLIFCVDTSKSETINTLISTYNINCSDPCFSEDNIKLIKDKKKCIKSCESDDIYFYEYKNICYDDCPGETHPTIDNLFLCQEKPEKYYLDPINNIFKPCYESCKSCNEEGNIENHNCIDCKLNYLKLNEVDKPNNCYIECIYLYYFDSGIYKCTTENSCPSNYAKLISAKNKCIDNCENDDTYQYEYENECFLNCPGTSHYSSDNLFLCQDNPEGYYLDYINNIFKPCYFTCQTCSINGNITNHNCDLCKEEYQFVDEPGHENNCYPICDNYYFDLEGEYHCNSIVECTSERPKYIKLKNECIDECKNDNLYQVEYNNECYITCPNETHVSSDNMFLCQDNPEGYYLDNDNIFKPCYESCKSCNEEGNIENHNCIDCKLNYLKLNEVDKPNNCYIECIYLYYFDSGIYKCTTENSCPSNYAKLISAKNKCIDNCENDDTYQYEENNICVKFSDDGKILICPINMPFEKQKECVEICTSEEFLNKECFLNNKDNQTAQNNIIQSIKTDLTQGRLNSILSNVVNGSKTDIILEDADTIYQITSSDNQNNNEYNNISSILLGDCEDKLKETYHIPKSESLIIFKIDIKEQGLKIPIIEYEIYNPINLEKLELDCCKDIKIGISIPVDIDEDSLFKYNSSDEYYNDICHSYTTENGTDIVIKDRQNEFKDNNMSLCESDCEYTNYNQSTKKALCECKAKASINSISDIINNKDKLLYSFKDLKNAINLEVMKCYKKMLNKDELLKNIGSYIILVILFVYIISFFAFLSKGYSLIYQTIHNLVVKINNERNNNKINKNLKENKRATHIKHHSKKQKKHKTNSNNNSLTIINNSSKNIYNTELRKKSKKKKTQKSKISISHKTSSQKINSNPINKRRKNKNSTKILNDELSSKCHTHTKLDIKYSYKSKPSSKNKLKVSFINEKNLDNRISIRNTKLKLQLSNYNDYEINHLLYTEAIGIDNRTYKQYYWSLLKQKHLIIFTFYTSNDYNSRIIKICLFFFNFGVYITISALFFNYKTMHKIYEDEGDFNFVYQIPQIIYSTIISSLINILVKTFSLTQNNVLELKNDKENIISKEKSLFGCLKIKYAIFFILSFIFLFFFWFYLACFCCIYPNTQIHLFKDSSISFALSLIYPFFINLFPGFFRIPSLKAAKKDKECLYKFSQIIQLI